VVLVGGRENVPKRRLITTATTISVAALAISSGHDRGARA
jgi:hypothetical protein